MLRVSNGGFVRKLGWKSMGAAKTRNWIAVLAITLTTVLFTALFTIGLSINDGFQQNNFRQVGGWSYGTFKYLTEEQFNELKDDKRIVDWGLRRFVGMPTDSPFQKDHVEIGYSDANQAHWMFCDPVEGRLPEEGTQEAAADVRVLELLGVEPELGTEFTVTFDVDGQETTQTFTLSGWWDHDPVSPASHILIPESRAEAIFQEVGLDPYHSRDGMTGSWNLDVMLNSSLYIEENLNAILADHGYQSDSGAEDGYIRTGVNWGYTGSQVSGNLDPILVLAVAAMLLLIILTGYLIIYNVFQISVAGDIRFYGLLKTIGATPRQLKRIIRQQALLLSLAGIPLGLLLGWLLGARLTPVVAGQLDAVSVVVSVHPLIFLGAALFSLLTVLLSCARPGRMAARVSPVEAVRYTEGGARKQKEKRSGKGVSLWSMAWANLGRSRGKTVVTVLSLSLAVVLLQMTVTFTKGFDMDKYLSHFVQADFVLADDSYFQTATGSFDADRALPETAIEEVNAQGGVEGGRIYGTTTAVQEFITEDYYRDFFGQWNSQEVLDWMVEQEEKNSDGRLAADAQLSGMEAYVLNKLTVLEGDLGKLLEPDSRYIAAVYADDDYGNILEGSHWAKIGDKVTLRYVDAFEYYDPETGEVFGEDSLDAAGYYRDRAKEYRDVEYEVAALVAVPFSLSYRYYGIGEFVLGAGAFQRDTGTSNVMLYAFDAEDEAAMETFLRDYAGGVNSGCDYESKQTYEAEFESFRQMFLLLGGVLSFIVGLVGVLNFVNAVLTGILSRKRELAVLQSVGMTGRQLKTMLTFEGLLYALGSILLALLLTLLLRPLASRLLEAMFWFFSYRFTVTPILLLTPIFTLLGVLTPLAVYHAVSKSTIVERLREAEG